MIDNDQPSSIIEASRLEMIGPEMGKGKMTNQKRGSPYDLGFVSRYGIDEKPERKDRWMQSFLRIPGIRRMATRTLDWRG
jgi:hypothetical protein